MDIGGMAKPPIIAAQPRPEGSATAGAVRTELPPEASVQAAPADEAVRYEPDDGAGRRAAVEAALREIIERHTEIDPKTREVVFQSVNRETGEVVRQVPDEALLKLRAYAREMRQLESGEPSEGTRVRKIA